MPDKIRILMVEDESNGVACLKQTLELLDYDVVGVAESGEEVIEKVVQLQPDLILMDITLSGKLDGITAAEKIHAASDIPIIFLTAHRDENIFSRAKKTAPYAYLVKPYEVSQLHHAIEIALTKQSLTRQINESEARYRTIFEVSDNAMMIVNQQNSIIMVNHEFERLTDYSKEMVENQMCWTDFLGAQDQVNVYEYQRRSKGGFNDYQKRFEALLKDKQGKAKNVYANVSYLLGADTYVISLSDITPLKEASDEIRQLNEVLNKTNAELMKEIAERKRVEKQLRHQANHDPLTGLPNRVLLFELLKQSIAFEDRHNTLLALMLLDLDNFKMINDTMGHLSGDVLLKKVAKRLLKSMRQYDTVGRIGGDEFVILANDMKTIQNIIRFAEKLTEMFREPFDILGHSVYVTGSIGIAIYPVHSTSVQTLLNMADMAMYAAKSVGKNAFRFFTDSMGRRDELESDMKSTARALLGDRTTIASFEAIEKFDATGSEKP